MDEWKGLMKAYSETQGLRNGEEHNEAEHRMPGGPAEDSFGFGSYRNPSEVFPLTDIEGGSFSFCMNLLGLPLPHYTQDSAIQYVPEAGAEGEGRQSYAPQPLHVPHPFPTA